MLKIEGGVKMKIDEIVFVCPECERRFVGVMDEKGVLHNKPYEILCCPFCGEEVEIERSKR